MKGMKAITVHQPESEYGDPVSDPLPQSRVYYHDKCKIVVHEPVEPGAEPVRLCPICRERMTYVGQRIFTDEIGIFRELVKAKGAIATEKMANTEVVELRRWQRNMHEAAGNVHGACHPLHRRGDR